MKYFLIIFVLVFDLTARAQYAPEAGMPGTSAIHQDSSVFVSWANKAKVARGWINIADTSLGRATAGTESSGMGKADNDVVSLGDRGVATLSFQHPVVNGPGWDFAVFENSFDGHFLELAFVEVSSDGQNYYRFPAHSLTPDTVQVGTFGTLDPTKINNLAGKYKVGFGTPFDLDEMKNIPNLDVNNIIKIRLIDVVGSIDTMYSTYDTAGNIINDPWPVSFASSGFDLDAVGVIHQFVGIDLSKKKSTIKIYPNPASDYIFIETKNIEALEIRIFNSSGICVYKKESLATTGFIDISSLPSGIYFLMVEKKGGEKLQRKFVVF